jgi:HAD superfamily hydrolase (TIGR01450 family)
MSVDLPPSSATEAYDGYFFDLDGTIYLGDQLLPGVRELFQWLNENRRTYMFVTNNPTKSVSAYEERLERMGINSAGRIVTSTTATIAWLKSNMPGAVVYPISEPPLREALEAAGIEISDDPKRIDVVIASFDRTFEYRKLDIAFQALAEEKRAILVATNPDRYCPTEGRLGVPDAAAVIGAIEACAQVRCSHVFGKPSPLLAEIASEIAGVALQNSIMVGDRLYTDVAMAISAGMKSALVLTGDSTLDDVRASTAGDRPTLCLASIDALIPKEPSL